MPRPAGQTHTGAMAAARDVGPELWLLWTLAVVVGWAIGEFVLRAFGEADWAAFVFRGAHVLGVGGAVLQALVLRRHLPHIAWWVLESGVATVLGGIAVHTATTWVVPFNRFLGAGPPLALTAPVGLAVLGSGLLVGLFQWLILRRHVTGAGWWIPASGLSLTVGWFLGALVIDIVNPRTYPATVDLVAGLLSAGIYGTITGFILCLHFRSRWTR